MEFSNFENYKTRKMNIVITGCSRGIGREIALLLGKSKKNKIVGIARNEDVLNEIAQTLSPNIFKGIPFDLNHIFDQSASLLEQINQHFIYTDILINNAGILINKSFRETNIDDARKILETNLFAPAELIKLLVPYMGKQGRGHIVNIGSMGGFQGSSKFNGLAWYSASKSAFACLTECLAEEFKGNNISVNCLALGSVQTEMLAEAFPGYNAPVQPSQMAEFIVNFALNGGDVFNGKVLPVALSNP